MLTFHVSAPRYKRGGKWVRTSGVSVEERAEEDENVVKNVENCVVQEYADSVDIKVSVITEDGVFTEAGV